MPELARGSKTVVVLALVAAIVGALAIVGYARSGSSRTAASKATTSTTAAAVSKLGVDGFGATQLSITQPNGQAGSYCALLASTGAQQAKGMMGRNDFGGYDAMVFPFNIDTSAQFYMANVTVPLSIAWIAANGELLATADMAPCGTDPSKCQHFSAGASYRMAIEVPQGNLTKLGLTSGATVVTGGPCR